MPIEIKHRITGHVICTGETVRAAVLANKNNLRGAYLQGADLRGADLRDADLQGANLTFTSHDLIAEILRRAADYDIAKLKVAGYILICREQCWSDFLRHRDPLSGWAMDELAKWVVNGDDAPRQLREHKAKLDEAASKVST